MVDGNDGHHLSVVPFLIKILIWGLRWIKCQKFGFLGIFLETGHLMFLIFCMMVESNGEHYLSVLPYLEKILIRGLRWIKCQKFRSLDIFAETGH